MSVNVAVLDFFERESVFCGNLSGWRVQPFRAREGYIEERKPLQFYEPRANGCRAEHRAAFRIFRPAIARALLLPSRSAGLWALLHYFLRIIS